MVDERDPTRPVTSGAPPAEPDRAESAESAESRTLGARLARLATRPIAVDPRHLLRWLLVTLVVLVPSAAWGVATASAQAALGPHVARYEVTLDHEVTVDLGPLGTLVIDSPLPFTLGARVVVQEIPREVTALEGIDTLEALGADLERYVQFFGAPSATLEDAVRALVADAARRTALATGLIVVTVWGTRAMLGPARRRELGDLVRPHRTVVAGGVVLALVVTSTVTASDHRVTAAGTDQEASAVFDGTPLEGARITGRLAGVIDTYGGYVVDAYRENEAFYSAAEANLEEAWAAREASDAALELLRESTQLRQEPDGGGRTADGTAQDEGTGDEGQEDDGSGDGGGEGTGDGDGTDEGEESADAPTGTATGEPDPDGGAPEDDGSVTEDTTPEEEGAQVEPAAEQAEPVTLLMVSDLHCNVGMAPLIGAAAHLSGAAILVDGGDTTVNGTGVESYCVTAFSSALPAGVDIVVSGGNHDSAETAAQYRAGGAHVLDGEVLELHGLRILGDTDPRATRIGAGTTLVGDETLPETAARLADLACADEAGVDLLLVHDPGMGDEALERDCVPAQLSGHFHRRIGPTRVGEGIRYVSSSTAGAALGRPTVGPLTGIAEMTVLRFDPTTRRLMDYRLVRVHPDASVEVGFAVRWPDGPRTPEPPHRQLGPPMAGVRSTLSPVVR